MPPPLEFSRPVHVDRIGPDGLHQRLVATAEERAGLAKRFGIESVDALEATLDLHAEPGGTVRVRGRLLAEVTQACVVTLEPVAQRIDEAVELRFVPEGTEAADADPEAPDEIPLTGGRILELGEALAEQLALGLDPYPRAPEAELPPEARDAAPAGGLAALARLRKR